MELVYLLEKILCRAVRCVAEALGTLPPAWPLWLFLFMQTISGSLLKVTGGGGKVKKKKKNPGLQTTWVVLTLLPESLLAGSGAALEGGKKQIHNPVLRF